MENNNYCFCTLALGKRYREYVLSLAQDLRQHAPGTKIVVFTDNPKDFVACANVLPFYHRQQGVLNCFHDKRFALAQSLSVYPSAIFIDADTRISTPVPEDVVWSPGITGRWENLEEHVAKYCPERLPAIRAVSKKMGIDLPQVNWMGDSLFVITRDGGREQTFFDAWARIGLYMELNGIHAGQGIVMGLAAESMGWKLN
ncbi:MAG: hypothetical protein AAGF75_03305, partial [Cyanobacteria bacterium P01_H01_bin.130]